MQTKLMTAQQLILCLAGELEIYPALLVEAIQQDEDLRRLIKSYTYGDFTYAQVLDTLADYF
jgi:hypothetical protein